MEFYRSYYSGSADFIDSINQFCVCIVGVVTSLALIYKINIVMILIILATCVCEVFFLKFLNAKEKKTKDERSSVFVRFDYYYNLSRDFSANSYFNLFSAVFQDYYFMPMTIAENICTTSNYDKEKLYSHLIRQVFWIK